MGKEDNSGKGGQFGKTRTDLEKGGPIWENEDQIEMIEVPGFRMQE